jgi:hypothetical protein
MVKNLSQTDSSLRKSCSLDQPEITPVEAPPLRRLYFINELVEWQLTQYLWTGCTKTELRDKIMDHASELIRQIIRKQGLHTIYPGQEESAFGDLLQTAWVQIERTLYKYRARPHCRKCFNPDRPSDSLLYEPQDKEYGIKTMEDIIDMHKRRCPYCSGPLSGSPILEPYQGCYGGSTTIIYRGMSKVFNMWSQIARTVILAFIKKEGRDRKNSSSYMNHLGSKSKPVSGVLNRFLGEMREMWRFHNDYIKIIDAIEYLFKTDERPHDGIIGKLVEHTGLSRTVVTGFIQLNKLRSVEFSDSNVNRGTDEVKIDRRRGGAADFEEES